jgi:choline dehydrogenase-like flavoprotein
LSHNRRGCARSGFCELGCAYNAKENALKVLIPEAITNGAWLYSDVHIEKVLTEGRQASGVRGYLTHPDSDGRRGYSVFAQARCVVLCGSAIGSAALHLRSDLRDPHQRAGRGLRLHPGAAIAGVFEDGFLDSWRGVPQSYECTEKLRFDPGAEDRAWILTAFAHPGGFAAMMPGFGPTHAAFMRNYRKTAVLCAMLHDESEGQVRVDSDGRPQIHYRLSEDDARALRKGLYHCGEILFAAGAKEVMVPLCEPLFCTSLSQLAPLLTHSFRPLDPPLTAVHPMGTLAMGTDPSRSVVDGAGRHHHIKGLYVADGSLFPTSLGAPPQISIYTAGRRVARTIHEDLH